jgi:glycosyltransferase involved in cell wall biosynthesis
MGVLLRKLDAIVAVNPQIFELFRRYGIAESRLSLIAPHSRIDRDTIAPALGEELEQFFDSHSPVFLSVGRVEDEYCLDLQINAFGRLRERWPKAGLVMVGSGSLHASIENLVARSTHSMDIRLTGDMPHGLVLRAIERATVLLRTTKFDGDAVSIREAMQLGTRVVASDNGMRPSGITLMKSLTAEDLIDSCTRCLSTSAIAVSDLSSNAADELDRVLELYDQLGESSRSRRR